MSDTHIRALLDRPSTKSMGMVPFVATSGGRFRVYGLADSRQKPDLHRSQDLDALVAAQSALRVDHVIHRTPQDKSVAWWIGDAFADAARKLGVPAPPLPSIESLVVGGRGAYRIQPAEHTYVLLEDWLAYALCVSVGRRDHDVARLMAWVLPDRLETRAALWYTTPENKREAELAWQLRTSDRSVQSRPEQYRSDLERVVAKATSAVPIVAVFVGGSGTHRGVVSRKKAEEWDAAYVSFATEIKGRIRGHRSPDELKLAAMRKGEALVDRNPMELARTVLENAPKKGVIVVDSVRHASVLDAVRILTRGKVVVIGVVADKDEQGRAIRKETGLRPEVVFTNTTEREIPELVAKADIRIDPLQPETWRNADRVVAS